MVAERNVLPASPKPSNYKLRITPNMSDFTFVGEVTITLTNDEPTTIVTLNYAELEFDSGSVATQDGTQLASFKAEDFVLDEKNMRVSLTLPKPISGRWTLTIAYRGIINDKMHGFYRSKFTTADGKENYLGTTQFEAVDARRAFPCWDEPVHKATFDLTLVVAKDVRALSNMPEVAREEVEKGQRVAVSFGTTPIMSTYLLAWTIGQMEVIARTIPKTRGGETLVRVFATEGKSAQGAFALEVACKVLPLYEEFFGSDYFIPKCDLLAIPDFAAGAMENWGLITYRETALLCDETSSAVHRQWVALVVAHELAHQWFGNLVTMDWWKELWLNEAFATWVEYYAVDVLFPEWNIFTQFVNDETGRALSMDALRSSHAVEVDVVNAQEIDEIFDAISYCKGGSVLRMTIEFIGIDAFRSGIRNYLDHFKFRNATTVDLWKFLGEAAGKPDLAKVLELWTGSQGYPYLSASRVGGVVSLQQNRFLSTGDTKEEEDQVVWSVPLLYRVAGETDNRATLFAERNGTITIPNADAAWVKINAKQAAFCRVKYSSEMLDAILSAVESKAVGNVDRLSLISDYHAFAQGGFIATVDILRLFSGYRAEDDYTVWCAIISAEADIRAMVYTQGAESLSKLNNFFKKLYAPCMASLGYTPSAADSHRNAQLRAALFGRLTTIGDEAAIQAALGMYDARETTPIAADLRGAVYATVVRERGAPAVAEMRSVAENTATEAMERARCLRAMASSRDAAILREIIEYGVSENVRAQDSLYIFVTVASNPASQALYVDCLMSKWVTFWARLPGMLLGRIVKAVEASADAALADTLETFWTTVPEEQRQAMDRSFRQGVEGIRNNASWAARDAAAVAAYVANQ